MGAARAFEGQHESSPPAPTEPADLAGRNAARLARLDENRRRSTSPTEPTPGLNNEAVLYRIRQATQASDKARFLRLAAGIKPKGKVLAAIKDHEAKARRLLFEAEAIERAATEDAWISQAIAETEALAQARGEQVGAEPVTKGAKATRRIMLSRGMGLEHARDNGYLTGAHGADRREELYELGLRYRKAFEIVEGGVTNRGEGGGGFGPKGPQLRLAQAGEELAMMRAAMSRRQTQVVDKVCGEGLGIRQAADACRMGAPASRNALRGGLEAAADALRAVSRAKPRGERPAPTAARLSRAARVVELAGRRL